MKKKHETVDNDCKHEDCIYRGWLSAPNGIATCDYILLKRASRNCKISECDKYKNGKRVSVNHFTYIETIIPEKDEKL